MTEIDLALVHEALPLIADATGVDFRSYRLPMVGRRLRTHMLSLGVHDAAVYLEQLRRSTAMRQAALERITIKVSRFFRNPVAFEQLARLLERDREPARVWVAGCGTGEEVWSLAMVLAQAGRAPTIIATDIDRQALAFAEAGRYPDAVQRDVPAPYARFLRPTGNGTVDVDDVLRARVRFAVHDLSREPAPRDDCHLVSCRNVLIYFQRSFQEVAHATLLAAVAPGGMLFLGEAEWLTAPALRATEVINASQRLFRRLPMPHPS